MGLERMQLLCVQGLKRHNSFMSFDELPVTGHVTVLCGTMTHMTT
jgi:hypothetical protein